ncbi:MAG: CDP-alcohol phosphatidyltransferase family protein [Mobilitalea sp.]
MKLLTKFSKKDLWTIPNILCYIRFALVPIFVVLYISAEEPREYLLAALIVLTSGMTDFLDGLIARKFHMITDLGKIIDPLADKMMQAALIFVLVVKIKGMFLLLLLFVIMQLFLLVAGLVMLKKGTKLNGSKWFGKISTAVFYAVMLALVAIPNIDSAVANILMVLCGAFLMLSFALYIKEYVDMYHRLKTTEVKNGLK